MSLEWQKERFFVECQNHSEQWLVNPQCPQGCLLFLQIASSSSPPRSNKPAPASYWP